MALFDHVFFGGLQCRSKPRTAPLLIFAAIVSKHDSSSMASRTFTRAFASSAAKHAVQKPPHLLSLADLTVPEIGTLLESAHRLKKNYQENRIPLQASQFGHSKETELLKGRSVAILMSKRSTRTRVASESATALLGASVLWHTRSPRLLMPSVFKVDMQCSWAPKISSLASTSLSMIPRKSSHPWSTASWLVSDIIQKSRYANSHKIEGIQYCI